MIGAIIGDVVGSIYEFDPIKREDFELFANKCSFTDDSILTIATARAILDKAKYEVKYREFGQKYPYPKGAYGSGFRAWLATEDMKPYNSYGNGSAMRVSPVGYAFNDENTVLEEAKKSAEMTHNHLEGIKGAQATALAILMARNGESKDYIRKIIKSVFGYNLDLTCDDIRPTYKFDSSCQGTVPQAIIAFLDSENFESAIRKAISLGGDSDTLACITGSIAQAFYQAIPEWIVHNALSTLPKDLLDTVNEFNAQFNVKF